MWASVRGLWKQGGCGEGKLYVGSADKTAHIWLHSYAAHEGGREWAAMEPAESERSTAVAQEAIHEQEGETGMWRATTKSCLGIGN